MVFNSAHLIALCAGICLKNIIYLVLNQILTSVKYNIS